jgi:hypothetical protein
VPPAAKRVQCPVVMSPLGHLPYSANGSGSVQANGGPVQPKGPYEPVEPIPAGFKPVAVVECVLVTSANHGIIRIDERRQAAVAGLGRLLAALREPSHPQPKAAFPACLTPIESWPWFVLVSASGQVIRPVIPVGICGQPTQEVLASLRALHWITLGTVSLPVGPLRPLPPLRPLGPPLHGGPIHDITPGITVSD